jgi:hypothetical protein
LDECEHKLSFEVKVFFQSDCLYQVDAAFALGDKEVGLIFKHIYQINPPDALKGNELVASIDRKLLFPWKTRCT